eukprot:scaffold819_cov350-Prasinococcus_capsulatus_cf.AAC.21
MSSSLRHRAAPDAKRHPSGSHATAAPATGGVAVATATATATTTTAPTTVMAPHGLPVASVAPAAALGEERQPCSGAASAGGNDARKACKGVAATSIPAAVSTSSAARRLATRMRAKIRSASGRACRWYGAVFGFRACMLLVRRDVHDDDGLLPCAERATAAGPVGLGDDGQHSADRHARLGVSWAAARPPKWQGGQTSLPGTERNQSGTTRAQQPHSLRGARLVVRVR